MRILLFIVLTACLHIPLIAGECAHTYDADVISTIDNEGDTYLDDYLYQGEIKTQMIYGIEPLNPKKFFSKPNTPLIHSAIINVWKRLKNTRELPILLHMISHLLKKSW